MIYLLSSIAFKDVLYVYLMIAVVGSIYLSRKYWLQWRETPSKYNLMTGRKLVDRSIDSFVFMIAFIFNLLLFPIALLEYTIRINKEKRGKAHVK